MTKIFRIDAFIGESFKGNTAAVCIMDGPKEDSWMQGVAKEMNLSETAFLSLPADSEGAYALRWFTPACEVALCGHATLASAHVLWEEGIVRPVEEVVFKTLSGALRVWRVASVIWMDFPGDMLERVPGPVGLMEALGLIPFDPDTVKVFKGRSDYLVDLDCAGGEDILKALSPDFKALGLIPSRGFIVTAASRIDGFDFTSRFFMPAYGIDEDAVTGSAHCTLGPFWGRRTGKTELMAYQASMRGGVVRVRLKANQENEARVYIGGNAVTAFKGRLKI